MNWRVILNGADITRKVSRVQTKFEAGNVCGDVSIELADRSALDGLVLPRVPQTRLIAVDALVGGSWISKGSFFLEETGYPRSQKSRTASAWGRSLAARLLKPWAPKISKQWPAATSIAAVLQELAAMCGVTIVIQNDYPVCQYCYAVSDWYPSQIVQDLAEKSGQICWPQADGSLLIAPRLYRDLPAPVVTLVANQIDVQSVRRQVPDFGNRILISGDGAVAGIAVTVVTLFDEDQCVAADGQSQVRLVAVVVGADGAPVALGTEVTWSCTDGLMLSPTSEVGTTMVVGEQHRADGYRKVTLDLPAASVVGVYDYGDVRKTRNLYTLLGGSVSGREITFAASLRYFDQALVVDYVVAGAEATWEAGWIPGDVTVFAAVAGAQGSTVIHQSNPSACASSIVLEAVPSSPCLGDLVTILAKVTMWGAHGVGQIQFRADGCGPLTSTRKTLGSMELSETLRTSQWGGVSRVRLSAVPAPDTTPSVVLTAAPAGNLYLSHDRQTILLSEVLTPGTQVTVTYQAAGTAMVGWRPTSVPSGNEAISETLTSIVTDVGGVNVAQVVLSRTPVAAPSCIPAMEIPDFYGSHDGKVVTLLEDNGVMIPAGTLVECTYQSPWLSQPGCSAVITATVQDGSQDGGSATITVTANDCREVAGENYDPEDPNQIPDEDPPNEDGEGDPTNPPDLDDPDDGVTPTGCDAASINARTPVVTAQNAAEIYGVPSVTNCPGVCTCDEICTALRASGRLAAAGMMWSQCMAACSKTRDDKCDGCTLTGPSTLAPGAEGTWQDDKTNSGEWRSTHLNLKERTSFNGYKATMPSGGKGPFVVKVCYGDDERTCCETTVDFPPCSLTGPDHLSQGEEGAFVPSLGMSEATAVVRNMEPARNGGTGFVTKLAAGQCTGEIDVYYGGRLCGTKAVADSYAETVGVVSGDTYLGGGETGYYSHNLGPGATYTGSLVLISQNDSGAVLMMPADAAPGASYTASWSARCGVVASMTVSSIYDTDGFCAMPWYACNTEGSPAGRIVSSGISGDTRCFRVLATYEPSIYGYTTPCTHWDGTRFNPSWNMIYAMGKVQMFIPSADGLSWSVRLYDVEVI